MTHITSRPAIDDDIDGRFTLVERDTNILTAVVNSGSNYDLTVFIKDGEDYDLNGETDGKVVDPLAIINEAKSNGGGGCSAGLGALALALIFPVIKITRRKK